MSESGGSVRELSVDIVSAALSNGLFADELLARALRHHAFAERDRALVTELVHGTLRWHGQLDWILAQYFHGDYKNAPVNLKRVLEVALYQVRFLNRIPTYAAVSEAVAMAKKAGGARWGNLVNGLLRNYIRTEKRLELPAIEEDDPCHSLAVTYSHPEWLVKRWLKQYGLDATVRLCQKNNSRPDISLRVNLAKTTPESLLKEFQESGIEASPSKYFNDFIRISKPRDLTQLRVFLDGHFAIQDESTAIPSLLLAPREGDVILDLCAAPGGKTCHLAQLNAGARVIAVDSRFDRMTRLTENVLRLQLTSVWAIVGDVRNLRLPQVDRILIDAPCSGLGVLAKRSDLRWKRHYQDILKIANRQKEILASAAELLKPGGELVYSTCTLEPEETEDVMDEFLERHPKFEVVGAESSLWPRFRTPEWYWKSLPHDHDMDGVFAAKLRKH